MPFKFNANFEASNHDCYTIRYGILMALLINQLEAATPINMFRVYSTRLLIIIIIWGKNYGQMGLRCFTRSNWKYATLSGRRPGTEGSTGSRGRKNAVDVELKKRGSWLKFE